MADAPPPAFRRGGPALLTDLPTDVLVHVLSFLPTIEERVRTCVTCTAFAAAVRPPSAAWADVCVHKRFFRRDPTVGDASIAALVDALARAAPSMRRIVVEVGYQDRDRRPDWERIAAALVIPAAPFLRDLVVDPRRQLSDALWLEPSLVGVTHLTHLRVGGLDVRGPPPLIVSNLAPLLASHARARGFQDLLPTYDDELSALLRGLVTTATDTSRSSEPIVLKCLAGLEFRTDGHEARCVDDLAHIGQHLTRLDVSYSPMILFHRREDDVIGASLMSRLPEVRELFFALADIGEFAARVRLDWRGVRTPPPRLTLLVLCIPRIVAFTLPPAVMASLEVLTLKTWESDLPPWFLRGVSRSFSRLTRLVYGVLTSSRAHISDLAPWGTPEFALPALVELEVVHGSFTLGTASGRDWARAVATTTLPRLTRLMLWGIARGATGSGPALPFVDSDACTAAEAKDAVERHLTEAAAEAGRGLVVRVWDVDTRDGDNAAFLHGRFGESPDLPSFELAFDRVSGEAVR